MAVPNSRSLHKTPTPHGGGLVIVIVCLVFYTIYTILVFNNFTWSYFIGAVLIASVSWVDDLFSISIIWRFLAHSAAALIVISGLGYFQEIYNPFGNFISIGLFGVFLTFFWIVGLINAYNFMDGIDGLAGTQAVTAGIGWLIAGKMLGVNGTGFYGGLLAFACLGFLIQNWQPAKIFMGDVGSAFLGYSFAVLPLLEIKEKVGFQVVLLIIAIVLLWLFLWDTILTFFRRIAQGEKVWLAHRGHIYQRFIIKGFSHKYVTCLYAVLSILNGSLLLLWLNFKGSFGLILLIFILLESFGLLIFLKFVEKNKAKK
ncbi:MAG: glycosyltransferase family 4 protein [Acidobacteriota bacterium]|nr:glycosyltransferase family 4 protein [Acidobacteriota bacterium]